MKLVILIPGYNEEATLGATLSELPRNVTGFTEVEWLVVDDGSTDRTAAIAREHGARVVSLRGNQGLGKAFSLGLQSALDRGADVIAQTDADNQYEARDLDALVGAIVAGADFAIGRRDVARREDFSAAKKWVHRTGALAFRWVSGVRVADPVSGFRAYSRRTAERIHVVNRFSYTLEVLLQAGRQSWAVREIPVRSRVAVRPSRLAATWREFFGRSLLCLGNGLVLHRPFLLFAWALLPWVLLARVLAESQGSAWAATQLAAVSAVLAAGIWLYRLGLMEKAGKAA